MKIEQAIKEYLIEIEVRQYSPRTIKGYRNNLNLFIRAMERPTRREALSGAKREILSLRL